MQKLPSLPRCSLAALILTLTVNAFAAPAPSTSANTTAAQPAVAQKWVDPTLLCSPENPAPKGAPAAVIGDELAKLAKTSRTNNQWLITLTSGGPALPLAANTNDAPKLLAYHPPAPGAPKTQPAVLVYQAGSAVLPDGTGRIAIVERALIFVPGATLPLGNALWAVRVATGPLAMAQPTWKWTADTLTVTNPFEKTIQEIALAPKPVK